MKITLEESGICVDKDWVQVRICFYLDPTDARYDEHHVQVPVIPGSGYPGEVDAMGNPVDMDDYHAWIDGLPKQWQNNPFHNHIIRVNPAITDEELKARMVRHGEEFYAMWASGKDAHAGWKPLKSDEQPKGTTENCFLKGLDLAARKDNFNQDSKKE